MAKTAVKYDEKAIQTLDALEHIRLRTADLGQLAGKAATVLAPGGLLAFATNAAKLSPADVDRSIAEGAAATGHDLRIVERCGLPADFPVNPGFPEGNYLKFVLAVKA